MLNKVSGLWFWPLISLSAAGSLAAGQTAARPRARVVNYTPEAAGLEVEVVQRLNNHERRIGHLEKVAGTPVAVRPKSGAAPSRPAAATGSKTKKPAATTHTVKSGETPYSIARRYGIPVAELIESNQLAGAGTIHPGQRLRLPGAGRPAAEPAPRERYGYTPQGSKPEARYTVKPGDTVSSLARRGGFSEQELMRRNALKDPTKLQSGSVLRLPSGSRLAPEATERAQPDPSDPSDLSDPSDPSDVSDGSDRGVAEAVPPLPDGWYWHHVEKGESLSQIAGRYRTDRRAIERENNLTGGSAAVREGMTLKIPPAEVATIERPTPLAKTQTRRWSADGDESVLGYTVQKGDSVDSVAEEFKTSASILRRLNRLGTAEALVAGRRIVVPNTLFE